MVQPLMKTWSAGLLYEKKTMTIKLQIPANALHHDCTPPEWQQWSQCDKTCAPASQHRFKAKTQENECAEYVTELRLCEMPFCNPEGRTLH